MIDLDNKAPIPSARADQRLPLLRMLTDRFVVRGERPHLLLITHVLETAVPFVKQLARHMDVSIVGIPYSFNKAAAAAIAEFGLEIVRPASIASIPEEAMALARRISNDHPQRPFLIQEIGGYLAKSWLELNQLSNLIGVVEDTNNGHWRYEEVANSVNFPILSIAQSPIKKIEDEAVGDAIVFSVERLMRQHFASTLRGLPVLVIGYGRIGRACSLALRDRGCRTYVHDTNPFQRMKASIEGFDIGALDKLLFAADLIIGATGTTSVDRHVLQNARSETVLVSGSSKRVEIDLDYLAETHEREACGDGLDLYRCADRTLYILNDGCPVNFRDASVLGRALDAVYSELFACMRELLFSDVPAGFHHSPISVHREVADVWCSLYGS